MCNVALAGSVRKFNSFNNVVVFPDRIDVYDFQDKIIMTLPRGKQKRKEFEALSFSLLDCLDSSLEYPCEDGLLEDVMFRSFYNPSDFSHDMGVIFDSLEESLEYIKNLKRIGVDTSGMAKFANNYWGSCGKA